MADMVLHHLLCDAGEECETLPPFVSNDLNVSRSAARKGGWVCDEIGDFCPEHTAEPRINWQVEPERTLVSIALVGPPVGDRYANQGGKGL